ncbi:MAG: hypothetical protein R3B70_46655 [Polyangiaceae bacterium]
MAARGPLRADPSAPESQSLVEDLLVPLTTWSVPSPRRSGADREAPPADPTNEPDEGSPPASPAPVG